IGRSEAAIMRADLESCRSGRTGRIRNPLYPQGYPGFESLALRQIMHKGPALTGRLFYITVYEDTLRCVYQTLRAVNSFEPAAQSAHVVKIRAKRICT